MNWKKAVAGVLTVGMLVGGMLVGFSVFGNTERVSASTTDKPERVWDYYSTSDPSRPGTDIDEYLYVVIHSPGHANTGTANMEWWDAKRNRDYFEGDHTALGYHTSVDWDEIRRAVPYDERANHAGTYSPPYNVNDKSIGLSIMDVGVKGSEYKQYLAIRNAIIETEYILKWFFKPYGEIDYDKVFDHVISHKEITEKYSTPSQKTDPYDIFDRINYDMDLFRIDILNYHYNGTTPNLDFRTGFGDLWN